MSVLAEERLALVRARHPGTVVLARRLSLAARAEPALVRAARLSAGLDAMAESDLWFSGLVASAGPLGLALDPGVADLLRDELDADEREVAWRLVAAHHGREPWSIRLEERINYLAAGADDPGEIEELLAAALDELHDTDERAALGIARWLLAALARLPAAAGASPAAAAARVVAGARLDGRIGALDALSAEQRATWLPKLLGGLGTVELPVRLVDRAVILGGDPVGAVAVRVPKTDPIAVTVDDVEVRLRAGEERRVTIRGRDARIRTIAGDLTTLSPVAVGRLMFKGDDVAPACAIAERTVVTVADAVALLDSRVLFVPATAPSAPALMEPPRVVGELAYVDVYESFTPAPLTTPEVGDRWRFADGRPGGGMVALLSPAEILVSVDLDPDIERGVALITERPWGAVFGLALGRNMQGFLRVAPLTAPAQAPSSVRVVPARDLKLADLGLLPHPLLGDAYVRRDVDRRLDETLARFTVVGVSGPSGWGKGRSLFEALKRAGATLAVPVDAEVDFERVLADTPPGAFAWLDHVLRELGAADRGVNVAAVLDADPQELRTGLVRVPATLTAAELDMAWEDFGPELALDPRNPWSDDELGARERAVARARTEGDPARLSLALRGFAQALAAVGRLDEAAGAADEAVRLARRTGARDPLARALQTLSSIQVSRHDERAIDNAAEALRLRRDDGGIELVHALEALANALEWLGRAESSLAPSEEAAALARELGDEALLAVQVEHLERRRTRVAGEQRLAGAHAAAPREAEPPSWNDGTVTIRNGWLLLPETAVPLIEIANVQLVKGSWRRFPVAQVERRDGTVIEVEIKAAPAINAAANNRAAEAFLAAVKSQ